MKKSLILIIMLAAGVFVSPFASAQSNFSVLYSVGVPMGSLSDHTSQVSGRGMDLEYQKFIKTNISVGVNLGYNVFYEAMPYGSYTSGTATLTGYQYRYNNLFPMLVNGQYHLNSSGAVKPYVGLGIGTMYSLRNTDMGLWTVEEDNWHFLLSPEAGILFKLSDMASLKLNAKYDNAFSTDSADGFANLNFNIGFVFHSGYMAIK
jgi:outer membrane protein W